MKLSTIGIGTAWLMCVLSGVASRASAQALTVIQTSEQDRIAADKLQELVGEPFKRLDGSAQTGWAGDARSACVADTRIALVLDTAHDAVRLLRCLDGTLLTRAVDPDAARATPYLAAFVAAELISLNGELENVRVEPSQPIVPIAELPAASTIEPASLERSSRLLRLRAGAELILVGAPYAGALRPTLGLGLSVARSATAPAWLFELQLSVLGSAELRRPGERLALTRHDGRLRAGLQLALGPLALAGLIHLRASLSQADYTGPTPVSNASLRLGLGAGVEADLELVRWLRIYADVLLDAATSRSEYRVGGTRWIRDPALILSAGLGLALVVPL